MERVWWTARYSTQLASHALSCWPARQIQGAETAPGPQGRMVATATQGSSGLRHKRGGNVDIRDQRIAMYQLQCKPCKDGR